jgi:hypothetical protein
MAEAEPREKTTGGAGPSRMRHSDATRVRKRVRLVRRAWSQQSIAPSAWRSNAGQRLQRCTARRGIIADAAVCK